MKLNDFKQFNESAMTCSECGGPAFSDLILAEKQDACYNKVKSRYKVWPSAYASGALVQCRKKGAANWGTKSESVAEGKDPNTQSHAEAFKSETDTMRPGTKKYVGRKGGKEVTAVKDDQGNVKFYHRDGIKGPLKAVKQGVAEGLNKRDQKDVAAIRAAIERLQAQLKQPNADKESIQQSIAHEKKRLALYGQGVAEAGPFSYGKAPRKGSVADLAAKKRREQEKGKQPVEPKDQMVGVAKVTKGVAEGLSDTVYPNAQVIKSKNGRPVGEIYQDSDGTWGAFHYRADRGADGMDSREDAIEELRFIHSETGRSGPDYTLKGVAEGLGQDSPVAQAITRRILMQRTDLLAKYGPGYVGQAIDDVVDSVGDVEEIGSSDVSGWVRQVEHNLKNKLNRYDEPMNVGDALDEEHNAEYDDEAGMADNNLETLARAVEGIDDLIQSGDNLPEWCQEKIAVAKSMLVAVWDYMYSEEASDEVDPEVDEMYEAMDQLAEEIAARDNIDVDLVWESFESLDDHMLYETAAWRRKEGKSKTGGLNAKGVASYRRENPGSKLQTAVTTKPSKLKPGSKAAKRRKSFCARMSGVKGPMKKPNGKPTRKALALRKWNC